MNTRFDPSEASKAWEDAGYDDPERAAERFPNGIRQAFVHGFHCGALHMIRLNNNASTSGDEYATSKVGEPGARMGMDNTYEHRALRDAFNAGAQSERNKQTGNNGQATHEQS